jgi:UDP-glucose 4-epimerase
MRIHPTRATNRRLVDFIVLPASDASAVSGLKHIILRYFNVAGADPLGRTGQSTKNATHLIKAAAETAVGKRPKIEVYGTDYNTADGTAVRD